jgi:diguanylate cyclase (GGDEF)-like protein/PAS domain S-box-containing protein
MKMVEQVGPAPEPRGELGAFSVAREDFARGWTAAVNSMVLANVSRAELEQLLLGFTDQLIVALTGNPYDPAIAHQVGRAMVDHDFISSATLERSVQYIGDAVMERFPLPNSLAARLMRVLGALSAGFADALRDRTMDQQELSKTAAILTIRKAEDALRASETKFRTVFSSSAVGIAVTALDGRILDFNESLLNLLDYTSDELRATTVRDLIHPDDRAAMTDAVERLEASGQEHFRTEKRMLRSDGDMVETLLAVSLVRDADDEPAYHVTMVENMNELRALQSQLVRQSLHDMHTGLPNRSQFVGWLESTAGTKGPDTIVLVHFDIDGFHVINDAFGHEVGNRVLMSIANNLRTVFDEIGQVARIGPDEFGVLVKDPKDTRTVITLVEEVLELMAEPLYIDEHGIAVTASVGIVARAAHDGDPSDLLRSADVTVGWAKTEGKAQWALYDRERDLLARKRCALAASIPGALEQGEFRVDYQPVYSLVGRELIAIEAKLRWDHPDEGVLDPEEFIDLTTSTGMVMGLGRWAMEHACEQAGRWYEEFGDAMPTLTMDLTARQCQEPELVAEIGGILQRTGLPAKLLQFEVSERLPAIITEDQADELDILASRGVRLVLDQLGGGNVSTERIRQIPLHGLKFNRSAVHGLDEGANRIDESAAVALLRWASKMRIPLYAEDVRTETELTRLGEFGITGVQGPYFGEPVTAEEIHRMLTG